MMYAVYLLVAAHLANARVPNELLPRACAGNNCNRAITGNSRGSATLAAHLADCSSYFSATVYPSPIIVAVTSTSTLNVGQTFTPPVQSTPNPAVTVTASAIPGYATAPCKGDVAARYASACSCGGVKRETTTLPASTFTTTVVVPSTIRSFIAAATNAAGSITYLSDPSSNFDPNSAHLLSFSPDIENATVLNLQFLPTGPFLEIGDSGFVGSQGLGQYTGGPIYFNSWASIGRYMGAALVWTVDGNGMLTGVNGRNPGTQMGNCGGVLGTMDLVTPPANCQPVTLHVEYIV